MPIATLTTDFGTGDFYVGAMKGVLLSEAPGAALVDISHDLDPGDIAGASFVLRGAAPNFPRDTVHIAVVDPGVGSDRRILIVDDGRHRLLAPDNGLLEPWLADGTSVVHSVADSDLFRRGPGQTFHGRDRFAPLGGALLRGARPEDLGAVITDPVRADTEPPRREPAILRGHIVHIDRFGNLVTDIPATWLPDGVGFAVHVGAYSTDVRVPHYAAIHEGAAAVLTGSLGLLEISMDGRSLARAWSVGRGAAVRIDIESSSEVDTESNSPRRASADLDNSVLN